MDPQLYMNEFRDCSQILIFPYSLHKDEHFLEKVFRLKRKETNSCFLKKDCMFDVYRGKQGIGRFQYLSVILPRRFLLNYKFVRSFIYFPFLFLKSYSYVQPINFIRKQIYKLSKYGVKKFSRIAYHDFSLDEWKATLQVLRDDVNAGQWSSLEDDIFRVFTDGTFEKMLKLRRSFALSKINQGLWEMGLKKFKV